MLVFLHIISHFQSVTCNFENSPLTTEQVCLRSICGSLYVIGKLPNYPSPKLTLTLTSHLWQMLAHGRGRWAVSQKRIMMRGKSHNGLLCEENCLRSLHLGSGSWFTLGP